jgi:RNA polymerase sigma factor (sigma-70 family)
MAPRDPFADSSRLLEQVYGYVAYRIGDGPEAEDVTAETFERALRYRASYDAAKGTPVMWLLGIARRCLQDAYSAASAPAVAASDGVAPIDIEDETVRRLILRAAVARLDERARELVALRYGADLTARQIAELLGMKTHAVEIALQRALGRLRLVLSSETAAEAQAAKNVVRISPLGR